MIEGSLITFGIMLSCVPHLLSVPPLLIERYQLIDM